MEKIKLFTEKLTSIIDDVGTTFNLRYNKDNDIKFNLKNTLYASALILNSKGIESVVSDLEADKIVYASKNALIKKRNDDKTSNHFKKVNNEILNMIYDDKNKFIHNYQFKLDLKKSRYIETNDLDKSLFINNTKKD